MDLKMVHWLPYLCTSRTGETPAAEGTETGKPNVFFNLFHQLLNKIYYD